MNTQELLRQALQHHGKNELPEAELLYRQILGQDPKNADALHFLGVLAGQMEHLPAAVDLISQAVLLRPSYVEALSNLGRFLADLGRYPESASAYQKATNLSPKDSAAWYALGLTLRMSGQAEDAISALQTAARLNPNFSAAHSEMGNAFRALGKTSQAIAAHQKAIGLDPRNASAHNNLGNAFTDKGDLENALHHYQLAAQLDSSQAAFHVNLGDALSRKSKFGEALAAYNLALKLQPHNTKAHNGVGVVFSELHRFDEAVAAHRAALEINPADPHTHQVLGETQLLQRDMVGAEKSFRQALELSPGSAAALNSLGVVLRSQGSFAEAEECFRQVLKSNPNDAMASKHLSASVNQPTDSEIDRLLALLEVVDLPMETRIATGFAAGKLLDDADRFDAAFARYAVANELVKATMAKDGFSFNPIALHDQTSRMIETFTLDFFKHRRNWGSEDDRPVFIVGMPRSGTSLVEQIAASHSSVFGAGELSDIKNHLASMDSAAAPRPVGDWTPEEISKIARTQSDRLTQLGEQATRIIDKMPGNILNLGLIATLFPRAKVIFCERDPRDNCLSCYFQWFAKNSLAFSYDLDDCATQYIEQKRLTSHWLKSLPISMFTMNYEELVLDLEGQSRRLIEFLGLPWEPACVDFHKTKRTVVTASVWQVRQPLYNSSVGRWRHYESHLGPLLQKLAGPQ